MSSTTAGALFLIFIAVVPAVLATTYTVGDTSGWARGVEYTTWAQGKTFRVGDALVFHYDPSHSVSVVDNVGYASCDSTREMASFSGGETKITLTSVGMNYFICPTPPGACSGGMKLAIRVFAAASSPGLPSVKES